MFLWVVLSLKHRVDELKRLIFRLRLWLLMAPARKDIFYLTGVNFLWRTVSKQCGFGQRIHWFIWVGTSCMGTCIVLIWRMEGRFQCTKRMGLFKNISNKIKSIKGKKRKWTVEKKPRIERKTNRTTKKKEK